MQWRRAQRPTLVATPGAVADAERESEDSDSARDGADLERDKLRNVGIEEVRARSRIGAPSSHSSFVPRRLHSSILAPPVPMRTSIPIHLVRSPSFVGARVCHSVPTTL
jgi:hypothetical protein